MSTTPSQERRDPPGAEAPGEGGPTEGSRAAGQPDGDWLVGSVHGLLASLRRAWTAVAPSVVPLLVPLLPGLALVVAAWVGAGWLTQHQHRAIQVAAESQAGLIGRDFELGLERRIRALEGAAATTARHRGTLEDWTLRVQPLAYQDLQFRAIVWLDPTLQVRAVAPPTERLFQALYPEDDDLRRVALQGVILDSTRDPSRGFVTPVLTLPSGERVLLFAAPLGDSLRSEYVLAPVRVRDLIDEVTSSSTKRGWSVAVTDGHTPLFGPRGQEIGPHAQDAGGADVQAGGLVWKVHAWPDERLGSQLGSPAPELVLWLGVAVAILTSLTILLLRTPAAPERP